MVSNTIDIQGKHQWKKKLVILILEFGYQLGWQPRWFILEDGVLSYYSSEEEVSQGCKGSVLLAACNINGELICLV